MPIPLGVDRAISHHAMGMPPKAVAASGTLVEYATSRVTNPEVQLIYSVSIS